MNEETKTKILKLLLVLFSLLLIGTIAVSVGLFLKLKQVPDSQPTSLIIDEDKESEKPSESSKEDEKVEIPVEDFYSKGLEFSSFGNGTCALCGIGSCTDNYLIVPLQNDDGDCVIEVSASAFKNNKDIKGIELPSTIIKIGAYAFYGSNIQEIEISKKVTSIGNFAFSNCAKLKEIKVESGNLNYASLDGVLYSKNEDILIQYPIGKEDTSLNIKRDVKEISTLAFHGVSALKKINYLGKSSQWSTIEIGAGNDFLDEIIINFVGNTEK